MTRGTSRHAVSGLTTWARYDAARMMAQDCAKIGQPGARGSVLTYQHGRTDVEVARIDTEATAWRVPSVTLPGEQPLVIVVPPLAVTRHDGTGYGDLTELGRATIRLVDDVDPDVLDYLGCDA